MTLLYVAMALLAISIHLPSVSMNAIANECNCRCQNLEWEDESGTTQGNCKSERQGEAWCYVDLDFGICADRALSDKYADEGIYWSKVACQTSNECYYDDEEAGPRYIY